MLLSWPGSLCFLSFRVFFRGEDKICSAGVLRSGILVGRVECFLYIRCYGEIFYNLPQTKNRYVSVYVQRCYVRAGRRRGRKKRPEAKVQKRIEGKGRRKERGVGKTEIRKTGGRGKGRNGRKKGEGTRGARSDVENKEEKNRRKGKRPEKGGRKKEAAGKKNAGYLRKTGKKEKRAGGEKAGTETGDGKRKERR